MIIYLPSCAAELLVFSSSRQLAVGCCKLALTGRCWLVFTGSSDTLAPGSWFRYFGPRNLNCPSFLQPRLPQTILNHIFGKRQRKSNDHPSFPSPSSLCTRCLSLRNLKIMKDGTASRKDVFLLPTSVYSCQVWLFPLLVVTAFILKCFISKDFLSILSTLSCQTILLPPHSIFQLCSMSERAFLDPLSNFV